MNHVGLTVEDLEGATEWYEDVLGFNKIAGPLEVERGVGHFGDIGADVVGEFEQMHFSHLTTANGCGLELFEYEATGPKDEDTDFRLPGLNHICVTDPDVAELCDRIVEHGGKQTSDIWTLFPDKDYQIAYCQDPYGNTVEIYSHDYATTYANQD